MKLEIQNTLCNLQTANRIGECSVWAAQPVSASSRHLGWSLLLPGMLVGSLLFRYTGEKRGLVIFGDF